MAYASATQFRADAIDMVQSEFDSPITMSRFLKGKSPKAACHRPGVLNHPGRGHDFALAL